MSSGSGIATRNPDSRMVSLVDPLWWNKRSSKLGDCFSSLYALRSPLTDID
ncbi:hypothetical protein GOODEAATRI_015420, partial [Goodea atripinnis]